MEKRVIKQFIFRTFLCFLLIGGVVLFITYQRSREVSVPSQSENTILLTGIVTENALRGAGIASFSQSDPLTSDSLVRLVKELENNTETLESTAKLVNVSAEQATTLEAVIATQTEAFQKFRAANTVFAKAISYDPIEDLTLLDASTQRAEIATRANAAATGLERIIADPTDTAAGQLGVGTVDGPQAVVSESVRQAIESQAACLRRLAEDAGSTAAQTKSMIQRCTDSYPALREEVVQHVLSLSFNDDYSEKLAELTQRLIGQLKKSSS